VTPFWESTRCVHVGWVPPYPPPRMSCAPSLALIVCVPGRVGTALMPMCAPARTNLCRPHVVRVCVCVTTRETWGRQTILYCTVVYCIGSAVLAITSGPEVAWGAFVALSLISVGTGGIKPCVSTFGADQFSWPGRKPVSKKVYDAELASYFMMFYFGINVGAMGSQVLTPLLRHYVGCVFFVCLLACWLALYERCGVGVHVELTLPVLVVVMVVAVGTCVLHVSRLSATLPHSVYPHASWLCPVSCYGRPAIGTTSSHPRAACW